MISFDEENKDSSLERKNILQDDIFSVIDKKTCNETLNENKTKIYTRQNTNETF
jgi:hypothetical protein